MKQIILILMVLFLIPMAHADIPAYDGNFGPNTGLLYQFKLMLENVDEAMTFNQTRKLEKIMAHAELRLSEAKTEMAQNRTTEKVMIKYLAKMAKVEQKINEFGNEQIKSRVEQQNTVLTKLIGDNYDNHNNPDNPDNPDNQGLQTALSTKKHIFINNKG